jgi:hypothetical protein
MKAGGDACINSQAAWDVNVRYQRGQGAQFAENLAVLSGAVACSPQENDYEFSKSIIFEDEKDKDKGSLPLKLLGAALTGGISLGSLGKLLGAASLGAKIKAHYEAFPQDPAAFTQWEAKAQSLWSKSANMADLADADMASMQG